jgi:O-antigen ligase
VKNPRSGWQSPRFSKLTGARLGIFLCAAFTMIPLDSTGQLFLGEIILPFLTVALLLLPARTRWLSNKVLLHCLLTLALTLAGYMLADAIHHTSPHDYLRGWARIVVLGTNFVGLALLGLDDEAYLWWYSLGLGFGSGVIYLAMGTPFALWKFSYALSASSIVLCLASIPSRLGAATIMGSYGVVNVTLLDSRAFGAVSFVVALLLFTRMRKRPNRRSLRQALSFSKLVLAGVTATLVLGVAYEVSQPMFKARRHQSNAVRLANVEAALSSIEQSPIIGHGSWAIDPRMEFAFRIAYYAFSGQSPDPYTAKHGARLPHSQILSAWYEGGLLGLAFFVYFGYLLVRYTLYCTFTRPYNYLTPLYLFVSLQSLWHLVMSPFGGSQRLVIAFAVAVLCRLCRERQEIERVSLSTSRQAA